jgi:hypothetical protein
MYNKLYNEVFLVKPAKIQRYIKIPIGFYISVWYTWFVVQHRDLYSVADLQYSIYDMH